MKQIAREPQRTAQATTFISTNFVFQTWVPKWSAHVPCTCPLHRQSGKLSLAHKAFQRKIRWAQNRGQISTLTNDPAALAKRKLDGGLPKRHALGQDSGGRIFGTRTFTLPICLKASGYFTHQPSIMRRQPLPTPVHLLLSSSMLLVVSRRSHVIQTSRASQPPTCVLPPAEFAINGGFSSHYLLWSRHLCFRVRFCTAENFANLGHDADELTRSFAQVWVKIYAQTQGKTNNKIIGHQDRSHKYSQTGFCTT